MAAAAAALVASIPKIPCRESLIMVHREALEAYLHEQLAVGECTDYAPNGLQVAGRERIETLVTGVTASAALLEAAAAAGADAVLVHHGYFWKGEDPRLVGMKGRRVRLLMEAGINLYAYHLPLDVHPELGNNAGLARLFGWEVTERRSAHGVPGLLWVGRPAAPLDPGALRRGLAEALGREPTHVAAAPERIERLAWCSGGAERLLEQAAGLGVDAYVSGEISEPTAHAARELGVHYFAAGHHATERSGVQALGAHLGEAFGINHRYIEISNPA